MNLGDPVTLRRSLGEGAAALYDRTAITFASTPPARQILAPQVLADIVTLGNFSYEVRFYHPANKGVLGANGLYSPTGSPYGVTKVENLDQSTSTSNQVRITVTNGSVVEKGTFTYNATAQSWTLLHERGGQAKGESRSSTTAANGDRVELHVYSDAQGNPTRTIRNTYRVFPWNTGANVRNPEELIESVDDPLGLAQATSYSYYADAITDGVNYGRLKSRQDPSGYWELFEYETYGRVVKTTSPMGNTPLGAAQNVRVRQQTYSYNAPHITTVDSVIVPNGSSVEVGREYRVNDYSFTQSIVCQTPGAAYNAASNLVTTTRYVTFGAFLGKVAKVENPDRTVENPNGTGTIYSYSSAGGQTTTTTLKGAFNSNRTDIISGTRTVRVTDERSELIQETVSDIQSNLVLSLKLASQFDSAGRVTRYDYADGGFELFQYGCCGLESSTGRDGITTTCSHDAWGRVNLQTRAGLGQRFTYDTEGRRLNTYRVGSNGSETLVETLAYNAAGELVSSTAFGTQVTSFAKVLDASGQTVKTTTLPGGATQVETYARDGSLVSVSGTAVSPKILEYGVENGERYVKEIKVGPAAAQTEWTKTFTDFAGRRYKTVYADGAIEQSFFNSAGQPVRQVDPDGVTTLIGYNNRGEQETVAVDLNGNNVIDLAGTDRVTKTSTTVATKTESSVNYTVLRTTTQVWETDNVDTPATISISEQSSNGLRTWQTTRGLTGTSVTVFDGSGGRATTTTTPDGVKTIQLYTGDRLTSNTVKTAADVQFAALTYAYDPHGRMLSATDARNGGTTFTYYGDDRLHSSTTPDPDVALSGPGYDAQATTYTYDSAGRVSTVTQPDGGVVTTTYWPTGAVKRTWGTRTYPVEYTYDPQGRVKTLTTWQNFAGDSGKAVTTWNYHAQRGWLENKRYNDNTGPSYTYKPSGWLLMRTWARTPLITTTYSYNAAGDLSGTDYSDATPDVTLAYDRSGRPKTMTDGSGARTLAYHASGQLEDETYTAGLLNTFVVDRSFDSLHRLSGLSVPTVSSVAYSYDTASRLDTVTSGQNTATYAYHANSSLVSTLIAKNAGTARLTTTKFYDKLNRLTSISSVPSAASALSYAYTYNAANQRTRVTREDNAFWAYGYDTLGQVTSGKKFVAESVPAIGQDYSWAFDDIGNRKTSTTNTATSNYTPNLLNQYSQRTVPGAIDVLGAASPLSTVTVAVNNGVPQLAARQGDLFYKQVTVNNTSAAQNAQLTITGVKNLVGPNGEDAVATVTQPVLLPQTPEQFVHDADGNLTADARWSYTWDGENRLIALETSASASAAGAARQKLEFAYDGQSRRIAKKRSTWNGSAWMLASHTLFIYSGWNLIAEFNALSSNVALRTYVWGLDLSGSFEGAGGVGGLLAIADAATSTTHFAAFDGNGNVAGLAKATDGTVTGKYDHNAFGELVLTDGTFAGANPFGFSTKYTDSESGHIYYGYRCYVPSGGRWLNRDPIEEAGGLNLYAFVNNDAVNLVDALGQRPISFYYDAFIHGDRGSWLEEPGPNPGNYYFKTDERGFGEFSASSLNARLFSVGEIESEKIGQAEEGGVSVINDTGFSHRRRLVTPLIWGPEESKKSPLATSRVTIKDGPCETTVSITAGAAYPFISGAPNIDYYVEFTFKKTGNGKIRVKMKGKRNNFPDYEGSVEGTLRYTWKSTSSGPGPINLNRSTSFERSFEIPE